MGHKYRLFSGDALRERGIGKLTFLVFSVIIGVVIYTAYEVLPFYYYFYELRNQMESVIRVAGTDTDEEIRVKLNYHIRKMDLPVGTDAELRQALRIEREGGVMHISLPYEEVFYITWKGKDYEIRRFKFFAEARGKF